LSAALTESAQGSSVTDNVDYGTLLYEYIRSAALAEKVDGQINLRQHFSSHRIDSLSRLDRNATQAEFLVYWRDHVSVAEGFGGYLTVQVQGFDPAFTLLLAQTITSDADTMINGLAGQALISQVKSATSQLYMAGVLLKNADDALTAFRNTHGDLDPSFAATELATIVGTLESQLASLQAQLQWSEANLQPGASQIVQLKLQVSAMQQQIQSERQRLADNTGSSYSNTVAQYNDLLANQQFASTTYQSAQQGLIVAQADAASKLNYAVAFVAPILPDHPTLPDPLISSLTLFLVFLSLYAIGNLLFAAFRDQSGI
jgi:capsular polysaccharide transport system permease protein